MRMSLGSLGTAEDRSLELARLAEVDTWYDQVYTAAKRVDSGATISKHDTLATITIRGRSLLLTGSMYYGDQQTGTTPDQRIQKFLASVDVEYPAYTPAPDVAAVGLISDLLQAKWGVPIPNSPADQPRIDEYYRRMSALQDSGFPSTYYPVEYPSQFAPHRAAVSAIQRSSTTGATAAAPGSGSSTVETSILQTAGESLGLDSGWFEANKWLVLGGAAVAVWFLFGRGK